MTFDFWITENKEILDYLFPHGVSSIGQLEEFEETKKALENLEMKKEIVEMINKGEV